MCSPKKGSRGNHPKGVIIPVTMNPKRPQSVPVMKINQKKRRHKHRAVMISIATLIRIINWLIANEHKRIKNQLILIERHLIWKKWRMILRYISMIFRAPHRCYRAQTLEQAAFVPLKAFIKLYEMICYRLALVAVQPIISPVLT